MGTLEKVIEGRSRVAPSKVEGSVWSREKRITREAWVCKALLLKERKLSRE